MQLWRGGALGSWRRDVFCTEEEPVSFSKVKRKGERIAEGKRGEHEARKG